MNRSLLRSSQGERWFRWRGKDVSRLENLSDIIFALAITLVAASSVPTSFDELSGMWRDLIATGLCFAMLLLIWRMHFVFFRRYDLEDGRTTLLNAVLLFLVITLTYPLKFLASFLVTYFTKGFSATDVTQVLTVAQAPQLTAIYSLGYGAVFAIFAALYAHAQSLADPLELTPIEREMTRLEVRQSLAHVMFAAVAIGLSLTLPLAVAVWSGFVYALIGPVMHALAVASRRRIKSLAADADQV